MDREDCSTQEITINADVESDSDADLLADAVNELHAAELPSLAAAVERAMRAR